MGITIGPIVLQSCYYLKDIQSIMELEELINKTCLIGLSYFDVDQTLLKQVQHSGRVISIDKEEGISIQLDQQQSEDTKAFILPPELSAWFIAPAGHYKNADCNIDIENPDYFVTWDITKTQESTPEGEHEWWGWEPRTAPPQVN